MTEAGGAGDQPSDARIRGQGAPEDEMEVDRSRQRAASAEQAPSCLESAEFSGVYREYFTFVWRSLRALGLRGAELDDAAQDVFVVVHRRLGAFEGRASLRTWIYAIVRHVASNHRRSLQRKTGLLDPLDECHATLDPGPDQQAENADTQRFLAAFVDSLDDDRRAIFGLVLVEQLAVPEAAHILGIPLNTAYSRVRAVKQAFREASEAYEARSP